MRLLRAHSRIKVAGTCLIGLFFLLAASVPAAEITGKGFPLRSSGTTSSPATSVSAPVPYATAPAQTGKTITSTPTTTTATASRLDGASSTAAFEEAPIVFAGAERRRNATGERKSYTMPSIWPALLAVVVVCGLFVAGLYFMKKYLPGHRQLFSHPAMELLGRTHLDQRRFVTLLRVGRRLVVVGVSMDEMRTLTEITDEAEITEIMEVARPKTEVGLTVFQRLFQRNVIEAEAEETRAMAREKVAELDAQMSSLRERVREIKSEESLPQEERSAPRRRSLDAVG